MEKQDESKPAGCKSFEEIYQDYFSRVFHTCQQFAKNREDALDWTQEIMLKIADSLAGFAGRSSLSTWIFSITRNYCITQLSRKNRFHFSDISLAEGLVTEQEDGEALQERIGREEQELVLCEYLAQLPERDKRFLELKYFSNYSIKDLQDEFQLSASAVKMRLLRARQKAGKVFTPRPAA